MVNTFVVSPDIAQAVRALDNRRLGKQRVEAQQILRVLLDAVIIARHLKAPPRPTGYTLEDDIARECWYKRVYSDYRALDHHISVRDRVLKGGWSNHPMALMWIGYERALKHYITLCIHEWVRRGFANSMRTYAVPDPVYPWWTRNSTLINSHICALVRKEIVRAEPTHYLPTFSFIMSTPFYSRGYLWVASLTLEQRRALQLADHPEYCHEQMNDIVRD